MENPQAFARPGFTAEQTESQEGMSLLDYFAAHAMAAHIGLLGNEEFKMEATRAGNGIVGIGIAKISYAIAEAMLQQRENKKHSRL